MPQLTTFRLYLLGIALLFAGYVTLEYNRPKPLDWSPTYTNKDKIPYGTYVLYDQLPRLLGTDSIEAVRLPVYSQLTGLSLDDISEEAPPLNDDDTTETDSTATDVASTDSSATTEGDEPDNEDMTDSTTMAEISETAQADSTIADADEEEYTGDDEDSDDNSTIPLRDARANYVFINQNFELSRLDARALLQFVARGNDAFVATQELRGYRGLLRDSLGFNLLEIDLTTHKGSKGLPVVDSVEVHFTNPALAHARIRLPGSSAGQRIVVDSGRVGRTLATDARNRAIFVRLDYGRGHFYLCTTPVAFTNYYLLKPTTTAFAAAALAYLPARQTWWDEYQKQGPIGEQSVLRVLFAHDALRLAYYLSLAGGLLFVLVAARRRQRIIPTIKPLPNTTLLFTRTVASLYRQGSTHSLIAEKKVALFLDYLRTRFQEMSPDLGDEAFRERLSQKSGVPRPRVDELLRLVNFARTAPQMTDQQLLILSKALADFRHEAGR
ncbi:DUF4350 domain-containing protein [Hymenobacter terrenus]|uniref:DUF4350 domain-containing protein n=1 Tax=Hymenobacter terrenus TaxID=1629124 RepID=UPI000619AB47|nr:DUF4350 domain-containing protein [Hymenobacter terrenus]